MLRILRLTIYLATFALVAGSANHAEAGRRGAFGHHSQVRVWHGNRVSAWTHRGPLGGRLTVVSTNSGRGVFWRSGWGWSRAQGYPHRWWSWNKRHNSHFASRRHARHAMNRWGHGSGSWQGGGEPRRQGVWYASPGFGSTAGRGGPVRQGEWRVH